MLSDSKPKWMTSSAAAALMALGVILRLRPYLANRSLWIDEAFLVLNILERDFGRLLQPLDHLQAAPVGFLVLERLVVLLLGPRELALRLPPLLFSVGSLKSSKGSGQRSDTLSELSSGSSAQREG